MCNYLHLKYIKSGNLIDIRITKNINITRLIFCGNLSFLILGFTKIL